MVMVVGRQKVADGIGGEEVTDDGDGSLVVVVVMYGNRGDRWSHWVVDGDS